jgi:hypothetical protein
MIDQSQLATLHGCDVYDPKGDKIGTVGQVYTGAGDQPDWVSVRTGFFGLNESLVPLQGARLEGDRLQVTYDKDTVKDAPNVDAGPDEPLGADEVGRLYDYYDLSQGGTWTGDAEYTRGGQSESYGAVRTSAPTETPT